MGGCNSDTLGLSNTLSEVVESVAMANKDPYEVISAEDLLSRIQDCNKRIIERMKSRIESKIESKIKSKIKSRIKSKIKMMKLMLMIKSMMNLIGKGFHINRYRRNSPFSEFISGKNG